MKKHELSNIKNEINNNLSTCTNITRKQDLKQIIGSVMQHINDNKTKKVIYDNMKDRMNK